MAIKLKNVIETVAKEKNVPEEVIEKALIEGIRAAVKKEFGYKDNVRVVFDKENDELKVFLRKKVTPFVENPKRDISLEEAKKYDENAEVGKYVEIPLSLEDLGRIALTAAKEAIQNKVARVEKNILFKEFKELEGKVVTGTVRRFEGDDIIVDLGRVEAVLPEEEQIKKENYKIGDRIRALILKVVKDGTYPIYEKRKVKRVLKAPEDQPLVILSRTHPNFLKRLIEIEVPEIQEEEIEIKAIAREPGERAKVAVYAKDKNIDPVGVVVGLKGSRIQTVSEELSGEKIDVIEWDPDPARFILRALSPARPRKWRLLEDEKRIEVAVPKEELSLAIGKGGINAKLAHKLTGWHIDILSEEDFERIQKLPRKNQS
ncbi:MAG: transcription termination factor NusA [Aquificae bacterium]|nr:transcription termination factor NusA [Aquificota bacterium]